jgi:hypothetical protein
VTDRTNPPHRPSRRPSDSHPWPEVTDLSRLYDHGAQWCINAAGHPPREAGYPDPLIHVPPFECRTAGLYIDDVTEDLDSPAHGLEIYAARPFRFGEPRIARPAPSTRIVFEYLDANDEPMARFSISLGQSTFWPSRYCAWPPLSAPHSDSEQRPSCGSAMLGL